MGSDAVMGSHRVDRHRDRGAVSVVCMPQPSKWIALRAMIVLRYVGCIGAGRQTRPVLILIERGIEFVLCQGVHGDSRYVAHYDVAAKVDAHAAGSARPSRNADGISTIPPGFSRESPSLGPSPSSRLLRSDAIEIFPRVTGILVKRTGPRRHRHSRNGYLLRK